MCYWLQIGLNNCNPDATSDIETPFYFLRRSLVLGKLNLAFPGQESVDTGIKI